jgi:hypothetical protein
VCVVCVCDVEGGLKFIVAVKCLIGTMRCGIKIRIGCTSIQDDYLYSQKMSTLWAFYRGGGT